MLNNFLVPPDTRIEANGTGPALELGPAAGQVLLLTLGITKIVEQESLDVAIWGSADGQEWGAAPLLAFPQKFYAGVYGLLLDLSKHPEVKHLQARWKVARWGVGSTKPMFEIYLFTEPAPAEAAA
jgi:hypothetical protein